MPTELHLQPRAVLTGLGAGVLTTLLFTLPPLLDIRGVRPILILRREPSRGPKDGILGLVLRGAPWVVLAHRCHGTDIVGARHWPGHALELVLEESA